MRAPADPSFGPLGIEISPMRRRHVRDVVAIERTAYPRPWSASLFYSEIGQRSSRAYLVAHHRGMLVGYGGLMCHGGEGHITTLAVHREFRGRRVGSRVLLALVREARRRGVESLVLEVRVANWTAQRLYARFGFRPIGIRRNYYAETGEDALVMWAGELGGEAMGARLASIAASIEGEGRP